MMLDQYIPKLVSVIVPVFNRAALVSKTLDSILSQTYPFIEVVAINDGSTDSSLSVLEGYADRFPSRVVVVNQENTGQVRARNNAIQMARGEYIAFLDSDDTWEKEKLALQIHLFKKNIGLVYCAIHEIDETGKIIKTVFCEPDVKGNAYGKLLVRNRMTGGSVVVTRKALDRVGIFDESFKAAENWDLWIRIANEFQIAYVNKPLVRYLKHQDNMSLDSKRMSEAAWAILQKHLPVRPSHGELRHFHDTAYANYYYAQGVSEFSNCSYGSARKFFYLSWRYRIFYKDSFLRIIRSLLGIKINRILSKLKR